MLAARTRKLISAHARKNKRTARMLANARKDHSIPLVGVFNLMHVYPPPVTEDNVRRETQRDPVLAQVYEMTTKGWPYNQDPELNPFFIRRDQAALCGE